MATRLPDRIGLGPEGAYGNQGFVLAVAGRLRGDHIHHDVEERRRRDAEDVCRQPAHHYWTLIGLDRATPGLISSEESIVAGGIVLVADQLEDGDAFRHHASTSVLYC